MGASGWDYRTKFVESLAQTLTILQEQELADNDFIWPWEDYDPEYLEGDPVPRPTTLDQLNAAKDDDVFWEEGTHTILDIGRIATDSDEDDHGLIRPLTADELVTLFGTERPSPEDLDQCLCRPARHSSLLPVAGTPGHLDRFVTGLRRSSLINAELRSYLAVTRR